VQYHVTDAIACARSSLLKLVGMKTLRLVITPRGREREIARHLLGQFGYFIEEGGSDKAASFAKTKPYTLN
jgi:hypothetical protein